MKKRAKYYKYHISWRDYNIYEYISENDHGVIVRYRGNSNIFYSSILKMSSEYRTIYYFTHNYIPIE